MTLNTICVFCGSASGSDPAFLQGATEAGAALAARDLTLVYGGGKVGLMGAVADGAMAAQGRAIGVMPQHLVAREIAHTGLSELIVVDTMHERKAKMSEMADGFLVLPGGAGTLEEAFEQWTWAQIAVHEKPIGFLNINGYFDSMLCMVDDMVAAGFINARYREMLIVEPDPGAILNRFAAYKPPARKTYETAQAVSDTSN
ncbi:TIGR00730 family Rossman fold protein [Shimia sp. R10_1]|uniref:LOG family protein n=1 Tax=Shimia sp. R10_1 TaxID=2821095 RepID=UPI001ADD3B62|nr:TIGR00730 family Rossman fold protein [Shimia sp. R10_1]